MSSDEHSVALGNTSCLEVPPIPLHQSLYVVWSGDNDCICPLCNDGNCVLSNCQCYTTTSFTPELSTGVMSNTQLCWSNIGYNRNNSNVHFFTEAKVCNGTDSFISKVFVSTSKFLVRGMLINEIKLSKL